MFHTSLVFPIDTQKNEVLLGKIHRGIGKDFFNAPGGKREGNETMRQCACRELLEEVGIQVQPSDLKKAAYINFGFDAPEKNHDAYVFTLESWNQEPKGSEEFEPVFFPIHETPFSDMWPGDHVWLPRVLTRESPFWHEVDYVGKKDVAHRNLGSLPTKIVLMRHAWAEHNGLGMYDSKGVYELSDRGLQDSKSIVSSLKKQEIDALYSSPLIRCQQTLTPLSGVIEIPITIDDRLKEIDFGINDQGPYVPEYKAKRVQDFSFAPPGGESFGDVIERCESFVRDIASNHAGETITICTHGNPGRAFHYILSGYDKQYLAKDFEFRQSDPVVFEIPKQQL